MMEEGFTWNERTQARGRCFSEQGNHKRYDMSYYHKLVAERSFDFNRKKEFVEVQIAEF